MSAPASTTAHPPQRLHALDAVRAVMMLLGLLLHAAASYTTIPLGAVWPYQDSSTSTVADLTLFGIHVFRMPIFFVMAGFFACMLHERRGAVGLLRNRATRIGVPFVVGVIVLQPLIIAGFRFSQASQAWGLADGIAEAGAIVGSSVSYIDTTAHLWFLYDLLYFYVAFVLLARMVAMLPTAWRTGFMNGFDRMLGSIWKVVPLAAVTFLTLQPMRSGGLDTTTSFTPDGTGLVAYGVFVGFGWLLWHRRERLPSIARFAWLQLGLGIATLVVHLTAVTRLGEAGLAGDAQAHLLATASCALGVWLLVFGITGLFLKYLDRPLPKVRYLVDASYWLYLLHLPFMTWQPGLFAGMSWPAELKIMAQLALATPIMLVSYHYLVRATPIGVVLNGRRFVRVWPFGRHAQRIVETQPGPATQPSANPS